MTSSHTPIDAGGIGQPVLRREDPRLLRGEGRYTHDRQLPGEAHMAIVRSPHAHARIVSIDASAARAMPGVLAVLTAADLEAAGLKPVTCYAQINGTVDLPLSNTDGTPRRITPIALLASERARFVGDAVAAVIAETVAQAADAAEAVVVQWDELPAVVMSRDALAAGAPQLWDAVPGNCAVDALFGDAKATDEAFASAAHVTRLTTWVHRVTGVMMETRAALAQFDSASGLTTVWCGGDNSVRLKADIAASLAIDKEAVRVIAGDVGGNYGTRNWCYPEYVLVAHAARTLGRPVSWRATRSESLLTDYQGRDLDTDAELALDADGRIRALRATLRSNVGAFTVAFVPINKSGELLTTVYDVPVAAVRCLAVTTNTSPTAPYRSAGRPEAMFIMERLLDLAAAELGIDRIEIRRRNLVLASAMPYRTALGLLYDSGDYPEAMDRALALADWRGFAARRAESAARGKWRGLGFANYLELTSGNPIERSDITVRPEGGVDVVIGTTPTGQGHDTAFTQCVASWLGLPQGEIRLIHGDTAIVREGGGSHSARSMRMAGIAMGHATDKVISRGRSIAAHLLEVAEPDVSFADGAYRLTGTDRSVSLYEAARAALERADLPEQLRGPLAASHTHKMTEPGYPYGAQVCEVEVDPDTGHVQLVAMSAVDDVGRAINPIILHGQTHGGFVQGATQALFEKVHYDTGTGQMLSATLQDYVMGRADDFPSFAVELMETLTPTNPLGVRGGGEGGTTPALAVVISAVVDALSHLGIRHLEMPVTGDRVWRAIESARAGRLAT
jgi:carbon-monoxide dehydrogenase large subunit